MLRTSLSNSALDGVIKIVLAKSSLLNEDMRRILQRSSSQSEALLTERSERDESRDSKNRDRNRGKLNKFVNAECQHFGKKGHIKNHCR